MTRVKVHPAPKEDIWHREPLTWRGLQMIGGRRSASVCCANGHSCTLTAHEIASNGDVSPSLVCPIKDCTWHVHVHLAGWSPTRA